MPDTTTGEKTCGVLGTAVLAFALAGCASIGPSSLKRDRIDYNNAVSDSWKQQMVLNIVRLRYGDAPQFMDVTSVVGSYSIDRTISAGTSQLNLHAPAGVIPNETVAAVTAGGEYGDRPTVSYTPLTGSKLADSVLNPIPPNSVFSMIASGYPADIVLSTTVRALNGVYNSEVRAGAKGASDPDWEPLLAAIRRLQASRAISLRLEKSDKGTVGTLVLAPGRGPEVDRDLAFVKKVLRLTPDNGDILLNYGALPRSPDELAVLSRSMLDIMTEISARIEVPPEDIARGRTPQAPPVAPSEMDIPISIHAGPSPPRDAFTAVHYRGSWYWISETDWASKRALSLLMLFLSLAEARETPVAPVLTIPVG